jgi:hypothetical protein
MGHFLIDFKVAGLLQSSLLTIFYMINHLIEIYINQSQTLKNILVYENLFETSAPILMLVLRLFGREMSSPHQCKSGL